MVAERSFVVTVRLKWWLRLYLGTLNVLCRWLGTEPNPDRVGYWVSRGLRIQVRPVVQPPKVT